MKNARKEMDGSKKSEDQTKKNKRAEKLKLLEHGDNTKWRNKVCKN